MTEKQTQSFLSKIIYATFAVLPLAISAIPWGILCGTLSIQAGLSSMQAQIMSLLVFSGTIQLSGIAILGAGGSWLGLVNNTIMIGARYSLYAATYQREIEKLPLIKRMFFAFFLIDEIFVIAQTEQFKKGYLDYTHVVISGVIFYVIWNMATFSGIYFAQVVQDIDQFGLDFTIVATFVAMMVPMIKNKAILIAAMTSGVCILFFSYLAVEQGLVISTLIGMLVGYSLDRRGVQ
ncbi:AzlC family ABC transporter permease [Pasteurella atlantica]|uniref:AzlC family ABC transporter permease n=1 Tax=Pasteurellaceae TaxID=712 RepID=UPI0027591986|nr:AzlC family ABC transporter permease [Pasteurella atlantica]MDP8098499.1 AzlC family ABC transporter permease [Pasteurella atlantica]MDP8106387.1 AzlC family ABC transporter permease [Pasteurella atlantica]MDP8116302.1 AzlC family ABC transporter permease [Pasteurella atlantica]